MGSTRGGTEGGLQLVDARTGRTRPLPGDLRTVESWAESLGGSVVSGRADGDGDGPGEGSSVVSLDGDGQLRWSAQLPTASYPAVTDACISITAQDGDVTCLDPRTGDERWTRSTGDSGRDDVQAEQVQAFFGTATDDVLTSLVAPDALAEAAAGGGRDGPRGSGEGKTVLALDARTGDVRWSTELPVASYVIATSRTTGYASTFFSSDRDSPTLIAFDLADGRVLWSTQVATSAFASAFWGPTLVQVDPDGVVHGLATGVELAG
nr:PQQ-binding-like beta-propeller repeat protein [Frigoribacterium faeni]